MFSNEILDKCSKKQETLKPWILQYLEKNWGKYITRYVSDRCLLRFTDNPGLMQAAKWNDFNSKSVIFCALNQRDPASTKYFCQILAIFELCHFLKNILAVFINVFYPLLCLFLKPLVPFGSCKTNSQNFADGSLPKREQIQFYLELSELVHQEKKSIVINSDRRYICH